MTKKKTAQWRYLGEDQGRISLEDGTFELKSGEVLTTTQDLTGHPLFEPVTGKPTKSTQESDQ